MSTVLVVEDDPHTRELVRMYLDRDGHQVLTAENGLEGLDLARSEAPDIVLLDLMMPAMNGLGSLPGVAPGFGRAHRDGYGNGGRG